MAAHPNVAVFVFDDLGDWISSADVAPKHGWRGKRVGAGAVHKEYPSPHRAEPHLAITDLPEYCNRRTPVVLGISQMDELPGLWVENIQAFPGLDPQTSQVVVRDPRDPIMAQAGGIAWLVVVLFKGIAVEAVQSIKRAYPKRPQPVNEYMGDEFRAQAFIGAEDPETEIQWARRQGLQEEQQQKCNGEKQTAGTPAHFACHGFLPAISLPIRGIE